MLILKQYKSCADCRCYEFATHGQENYCTLGFLLEKLEKTVDRRNQTLNDVLYFAHKPKFGCVQKLYPKSKQVDLETARNIAVILSDICNRLERIKILLKERGNWCFLADGLKYDHQSSCKADMMQKVDNIDWQIAEIKKEDDGRAINVQLRAIIIKKHRLQKQVQLKQHENGK